MQLADDEDRNFITIAKRPRQYISDSLVSLAILCKSKICVDIFTSSILQNIIREYLFHDNNEALYCFRCYQEDKPIRMYSVKQLCFKYGLSKYNRPKRRDYLWYFFRYRKYVSRTIRLV